MLAKLNPFVRMVQRQTFQKKQSVMSLAEDCRIFYSMTAKYSMTVGETEYPIQPGTLLFIPPRTPYRICPCTVESSSIVVMSFSLTSATSWHTKPTFLFPVGMLPDVVLDEEPMPPFDRPIYFWDASHLERQIEQLLVTRYSPDPYARELLSVYLKKLLLDVLALDKTTVKTSPRVRRAIQFIEAHYAEPIRNEDVAQDIGLHPNYLNAQVRRELGVGLHRYLVNYRVQVAARFIVAGEENIERIALRCGFTYSSHLIAAFRSITGMTPKQYQLAHKTKTDFANKG